jgi:hypothetical protein
VALAWGLVVLSSAVGFGASFARLALPRLAPLGWGFEAALGFAIHIAIGGGLALAGLVSPVTANAVVALGVAALAWARWTGDARSREPVEPLRIAGALVLLAAMLACALACAGKAAYRSVNPSDDWLAYLVFPAKLLQTGTLLEPFSWRRLTALGGQSYMHALLLAHGAPNRLGLFDGGLCVAVLAGLASGWSRSGTRWRPESALPALVVLFAFPIRQNVDGAPLNVASQYSGAVFFLAMVRVLDAARGSPLSWGRCLALALLGAAFSSLRNNYMLPAFVLMATWFAGRFAREVTRRRDVAREAVGTMALAAAALAPWMALAYRSSGTPLYPVVQGNAAPEYFLPSPATMRETVAFLVALNASPLRARAVLLAIPAAFLLPWRRDTDAVRAAAVASLVSLVAVALVEASYDDGHSVWRYCFGVEVATFMAVCLTAARVVVETDPRPTPRAGWAAALVGAAVVWLVVEHRAAAGRVFNGDARALAREWVYGPNARFEADSRARYREIQGAVPAGERLLVMLAEPYRLDFTRNDVECLDLPGGASPPPHLPVGAGPEAVASYLRGLGLRYVAFQIGGDAREYQLEPYRTAAAGPPPRHDWKSKASIIHAEGRYFVDIFENLQALAESRRQLYAAGAVRVMDLAQWRGERP